MLKYSTILHEIRFRLGLSVNEYIIVDMIYHLQVYPKSSVPGWCYASKQSIADEIGLSKMQITRIINKLIDLGLVERDNYTKYLRTTPNWFQCFKNTPSNEMLHRQSQNVTPEVTKCDSDSNKMLHNNNKDKKEDNNKDNTVRTQRELFSDPKAYSKFVEVWFNFYFKQTGIEPKFNGADGKAAKSIIKHLKKVKNQDKTVIETFEHILENWHMQDEWMRKAALDIKVFESKLNNIILQLNPKSNVKTETVGQRIEREVLEKLSRERDQESEPL